MKAPQALRLDPTAEDADDQLVRGVTSFTTETSAALQKGLTFQDNVVSQWITLRATIQDDWVAPTLLNSWLQYDGVSAPVGYRKDPDGRVWLRGTIKSGTTTNRTPIFILPAGYLPAYEHYLATYGAIAGPADGFASVYVVPSGQVQVGTVANSSWLGLENISFQAADRAPVPPTNGWPLDFLCTVPSRPKAVFCTEIRSQAQNSNTNTTQPDWDYVVKSGKPYVRIRNMPGLAPGGYFLTFLAIWK